MTLVSGCNPGIGVAARAGVAAKHNAADIPIQPLKIRL
jgi:hypothetical protein